MDTLCEWRSLILLDMTRIFVSRYRHGYNSFNRGTCLESFFWGPLPGCSSAGVNFQHMLSTLWASGSAGVALASCAFTQPPSTTTVERVKL